LDALKIEKEIGAQDFEMRYEELLSNLYEQTGRHKEALLHYKKAITLKDTIFSTENKKQLIKKEMTFEFEKKEALAKADTEKQQAMAAAEKQKQRIFLILVTCILILVFVFAVFMHRRFKITQRQKVIIEKQKAQVDTAYVELDIKNKEIELQKKIVEEHHKEVMDSIRYAKRIQTALITSEKSIENSLKRLMKNN
jgi:tetratricopeptide (TPR) repeat protein